MTLAYRNVFNQDASTDILLLDVDANAIADLGDALAERFFREPVAVRVEIQRLPKPLALAVLAHVICRLNGAPCSVGTQLRDTLTQIAVDAVR